MALETEVKMQLASGEMGQLRNRLVDLGSGIVHKRAEEINLLFDDSQRSLKIADKLIRLRSYGGDSLLTFKGPVQSDPLFKKRSEFQTRVSDYQAVRSILEGLGYQVVFRYDKFREIRRWEVEAGALEVCLDETPVGDFAEIEGEEEAIRQAIDLLGWQNRASVTSSYVELYRQAGLGAS